MEHAAVDKRRDEMQTARRQIPNALGPGRGYAPISECRRSDFLVRYTYVEKRAKNVLRWQFIFYHPARRGTWPLSTAMKTTQHCSNPA